MQKSWGALVFGLGFVGVAASGSLAGCSSGDPRPGVTGEADDGGLTTNDGGRPGTGTDAGGDASVRGNSRAECTNTKRDLQETDVDCGGAECMPCIDGKTCSADTDCLGGTCSKTTNTCVTATCTDALTNGNETDLDCGGPVCARCNIGRRCTVGTDCVGGVCDTAKKQCACPKGMVEASKAGGNGAYCIDEVEVTKYQYNRFITANVPVAEQDATCKEVNDTFVPRGAWPPAAAPPFLPTAGAAQNFNYSLPVHYVDWCDAYAYCKWANKQLCGQVGGGSVPFTDYKSAAADAWYNACSAQGNITYPYGNQFFDSKCNGGQGVGAPSADAASGPIDAQKTGYGAVSNQDEGIHYSVNGDANGGYTLIQFAACAGGVTGLYHMSGNVAEWQNSCDGTTGAANCRIRGGSYADGVSAAAKLACDANRTQQRVPAKPAQGDPDVLKDVGIRCCLF